MAMKIAALILLPGKRHATHRYVYPTHFFIRAGAGSKTRACEEITPADFPDDHGVNRYWQNAADNT
jgi:hypothetical protein